MDAGRSMTSPAAILWVNASGSVTIFPDKGFSWEGCQDKRPQQSIARLLRSHDDRFKKTGQHDHVQRFKRLKNGSQAANERFFAFPEIRLFY
jgi:hypothetical protein